MTEAKKKKTSPKRSHRHEDPVVHVDTDQPQPGAPAIAIDDETVVHPAGHRFGGVISTADTPNLSPGGAVTIKR